MQVKEAMHKGVEWMAPTASLVEIAQKMKEHDIGAIPIGENDRLVGMVTDRDITTKGLTSTKPIKDLTAADVMTKGIIYCRDSEELGDALRIMEDKRSAGCPSSIRTIAWSACSASAMCHMRHHTS